MRSTITIILLLLTHLSTAQIGGRYVFQFMNLPPSARAAALGGSQIAVIDDDLSLAAQNPALLNPDMHQQVSLSFSDYIADVIYGYASYARYMSSIKSTLQGGIRYINYGKFVKADQFGNITGRFSAGEYNIHLAGSRQFGRFSAGAGLNFISSRLESYTSSALTFDLGATYADEKKLFATSLVIKNLGFQLKAYNPGNPAPLPLNIQLGASKKFEHMPLRLTVIAHHLNIPDFTYKSPLALRQRNLSTGQQIEEKVPITEKIFRHFIFSGELVFSPNFQLRFGYNHQRRKEMTLEGSKGLVGFTFGAGVKVSRFRINYAYAAYHLAGASNFITLSSNLSEWFHKESTEEKNPK